MKKILSAIALTLCLCFVAGECFAQVKVLSKTTAEKLTTNLINNNTTVAVQAEANVILSTTLKGNSDLNPRVLEKAKVLKEEYPDLFDIFKASPTNQKYVDAIEN